jgi:c(7)-type cytochrome triheme protein
MIDPKFSLDPADDSEMPPLDMNILIPAKGDYVDDVIYPHEIHTYWLKCEVCHPQIFIPAKGQNNMSMVGIVKGEWCGRCHNKVAFPLTDCKRCHSSPKKKAKK